MSVEELEVTPTLAEFREFAKTRKVIPVYLRRLADEVTPVGLYRALGTGRPGTFLFESAEHGRSWSRFSIVGVGCCAVLTAQREQGVWTGQLPVALSRKGRFLDLLRETLAFLRSPVHVELPPFIGGLVGYLGFDVIRHIEKLPRHHLTEPNTPDSVFGLVTDVAVLDHRESHVFLIANAINFDGTDAGVDEAWHSARSRVIAMAEKLTTGHANTAATTGAGLAESGLETSQSVHRCTSSAEFMGSVAKAQAHIQAGDAFQIVLSQRFEMATPTESFDIYRALRATNPSPYLYYLRVPDADQEAVLFDIAGSSPEALVTVRSGHVTMHPIAGTRPLRSKQDLDEDVAQLARSLLADEKETAEHLMLVDLGRNDLSRVCEPGSINVSQFMEIERYSHVMHLVSTVEGELSEGMSALDAVLATFPAGTLSGAPKIRAIEIIDSLEPTPRGVYGGAVGYFDFADNADMAIAIRTAVAYPEVTHVQAGAGIVAESLASAEDAECVAKAQAVVAAIQRARRLET